MYVFFRVDVSNKIGAGHIKRCIRIAKLFRRSKITFILSKNNENLNFFKNSKYRIIEINNPNLDIKKDIKRTLSIINKTKSSEKKILFVDSYNLGLVWETKIKKKVDKLIAIDDLKRKHNVDLLINQNWYFKENINYFKCYNNIENLAFGPNYHLGEKKILNNNKKIYWTLFFGGSDHYNITLKILRLISLNKKIKICVVCLNSSKYNLEKIKNYIKQKNLKNVILKINLENLSKILLNTKFFIGSGGSTTWERILYRIPSIIIPTTQDQKVLSNELSKNGLQIILYKNEISISNIQKKIKELKKNYIKISNKMENLVDNYGLERIRLIIDDKLRKKQKFRKVNKNDLGFLYFNVNQPDAISSRFRNKEITLKEHKKWFFKMLNSKNIEMYLMLINKVPIGFIRYDITKYHAFIDIYTDKNFRNNNISSEMLKLTIENLKKKRKVYKFIAKVKTNNIKSIRFFKKNNFLFRNKHYVFEIY